MCVAIYRIPPYAIPLKKRLEKVMNGEKTFLSRILTPCEKAA
ncbi:hypothetical protein [Candidatus Soleaferrea massiliensis]|nr:hypothetical protein [Candidatus Soleaferrea massiliensis]